MSERPIIFSAPMVRALLAGRKAQTRRIIKPKAWNKNGDVVNINIASAANYTKGADGRMYFAFVHPRGGPLTAYVSPYAVGDRLWVREACFAQSSPDGEGVAYPADSSWRIIDHTKEATEKWLDLLYYRRRNDDGFEGSTGKLVPPIHMPRWASRITLEVTEVRVQRLQEISEEDARAEGIFKFFGIEAYGYDKKGMPARHAMDTARDTFAALWASIHGPDAWAANPWLAAISFKRIT